jgi:hypothetical protein
MSMSPGFGNIVVQENAQFQSCLEWMVSSCSREDDVISCKYLRALARATWKSSKYEKSSRPLQWKLTVSYADVFHRNDQ